MAYNARKIAVTDFFPNIGVGVGIPFSNPQCFVSTYTSQEAIKNNLINFFLTETYERPLNPGFGAGLRSQIFQGIVQDNLDDIKDYIISKMKESFEGINLAEVSVLGIPDTNSIKIIIKYSVPTQGINDEIEVTLGA